MPHVFTLRDVAPRGRRLIGAGMALCAFLSTGAAPAGSGKPVKVFLVAGQSNAAGYNHVNEYAQGRRPFPQELRDQTSVLFWLQGGAGSTNAWATLRVGASGAFGPEIGFAHDVAQASPGGDIAIIKYASGGTGIARSCDYTDFIPQLKSFDDHGLNWHPTEAGRDAGILYSNLIRTAKEALSALDRAGRSWELAGLVWMQGEHEAGISRGMAADYGKLLENFVQAVRRDLGAPDLPVLVGEINSHTWAYGDLARAGQRAFCERDAHAALVKTADLSRNGSGGAAHFDADGMLELGSRFASALRSVSPAGAPAPAR